MTDAITLPTEIRAPRGARMMQILWQDGKEQSYTHQVLRGFCPCAYCQGHQGAIEWVEDTEDLPAEALDLSDIREVGSYALQLHWGDRHSTGIYTFAYLRELGELATVGMVDLKTRQFRR